MKGAEHIVFMHPWIHWVYLSVVTIATLGAVWLAVQRLWQLRRAGERPKRDRAINELIWTLVPLLLLIVLAWRAWWLPSGW